MEFRMCFLTDEKNFTAVIIGATMYGSTSVRRVVHTLTPNRTYKRQPLSGTFN